MFPSNNSKQLMKKVVGLAPPAYSDIASICEKTKIWTRKEDIQLAELVEQHGVKNWSKIAQMLRMTSK